MHVFQLLRLIFVNEELKMIYFILVTIMTVPSNLSCSVNSCYGGAISEQNIRLVRKLINLAIYKEHLPNIFS